MGIVIKEFFLLTLLVVLFALGRTNRKSEDRLQTGPMHEQIELALALAQSLDATNNRAPKPASAESLAELEAKEIRLDRPLTETEADHLLGLFQPPSARQVDILKHFRIPRTMGMNKTLASFYIQDIFSEPANVAEWNQRPPTSNVKQGILFMSGQLISGMTQVEAQSKLLQYGMENPLKYGEWKHIEKLFMAVNDDAILECHGARKITWKRFFQLYYAVKASGVAITEIGVESILKQAKQKEAQEHSTNGPLQLGDMTMSPS